MNGDGYIVSIVNVMKSTTNWDTKPQWWLDYQEHLKRWQPLLCCIVNPTTAAILEKGYPEICNDCFYDLYCKKGPDVKDMMK